LVLSAAWVACDGAGSKSSEPSTAGARSTTGGSAGANGGSSNASGGNADIAGTSGGNAATATGGKGPFTGGTTGESGASTSGAGHTAGALGAYPHTPSPITRGGTMTFTNIGAAGWWPRRIDRPAGDPACDYKDGKDTWGAHCCMKQNPTSSTSLSPFDQEMVLILKALEVKQLAVYQAEDVGSPRFDRVTSWDQRSRASENLWFTQKGAGSAEFPGDLTKNDCVGYLSQAPLFACGDERDYYCPNDPGVLHRGFSGSKLVVFLASMKFADTSVMKCDGAGVGHPGPWVAFVASELVRDGGRKWNGACNCYSKTGTVGDGCGEINVFEVVMDGNDFSNREFASTGVRSFQAGHVGGSVCKASCDRSAFPADVEVVDACAGKAYERGPVIAAGGSADGCPVWRRPDGDRYFFILLDQDTRTIQIGVVHPANIPSALAPLLPELPSALGRADIDAIVRLRLPQ
jgi:hypothetical protein